MRHTEGIKNEEIKDVVNYIVSKYKNRDPFYIARQLGIRCVRIPCDIMGFSQKSNTDEIGTIYINDKLNPYASKIICAHELGHLCIHPDDDSNLFDKSIDTLKEYQANLFTVYLMPQISTVDISTLPICTLNEYVSHKIELTDTLEQKLQMI